MRLALGQEVAVRIALLAATFAQDLPHGHGTREPTSQRRIGWLDEILGPFVENVITRELLRRFRKNATQAVPVDQKIVDDLVGDQLVLGGGGIELDEELARRLVVARQRRQPTPSRQRVATGLTHFDGDIDMTKQGAGS